jgi:hypothetical protein
MVWTAGRGVGSAFNRAIYCVAIIFCTMDGTRHSSDIGPDDSKTKDYRPGRYFFYYIKRRNVD